MRSALQLGALDLDRSHVCYIVQSEQESSRKEIEEPKQGIVLSREA